MKNNLVINPFSNKVLGQCSQICQEGEDYGEELSFSSATTQSNHLPVRFAGNHL